MAKKLDSLLEMMNQMKDEFRTGQANMQTTVDGLKGEMQTTVDGLKGEIQTGQAKMQTTLDGFAQITEANFDRMEREFLNARKDVEEKIVNVEKRIEENNVRVEREILDIRKDVEEKMGSLEQRMEIKLRESITVSNTSGGNHMTNIRVKPCLYTGETPWDEYILQFEIVAEINKWDSLEKAKILATVLRESAVSVLNNLAEPDRLDYNKLTEALKLRFGDEHLTELLHGQLHDRVQLYNESLTSYAQDIHKLSRKAFRECPSHTQELVATRQFIQGLLNKEVQKMVRLATPNSLQQALVKALEIEAAIRASSESRTVRCLDSTDDDQYVRKVGYDANRPRIVTNSTQFRPRGPLRCWECGKVGHVRRYCMSSAVLKKTVEQGTNTTSENTHYIANVRGRGLATYSEESPEPIKEFFISKIASSPVVQGYIENISCRMLIDTGANVTLVNPRMLSKLTRNLTARPTALNRNVILKTANGEQIAVKEILNLKLSIGNYQSDHEVYVADIVDDCILGAEFLRKNNCAVDLKDNVLRIGKVEEVLLCCNVSAKEELKITAPRDLSLPPEAEVVVKSKQTTSSKIKQTKRLSKDEKTTTTKHLTIKNMTSTTTKKLTSTTAINVGNITSTSASSIRSTTTSTAGRSVGSTATSTIGRSVGSTTTSAAGRSVGNSATSTIERSVGSTTISTAGRSVGSTAARHIESTTTRNLTSTVAKNVRSATVANVTRPNTTANSLSATTSKQTTLLPSVTPTRVGLAKRLAQKMEVIQKREEQHKDISTTTKGTVMRSAADEVEVAKVPRRNRTTTTELIEETPDANLPRDKDEGNPNVVTLTLPTAIGIALIVLICCFCTRPSGAYCFHFLRKPDQPSRKQAKAAEARERKERNARLPAQKKAAADKKAEEKEEQQNQKNREKAEKRRKLLEEKRSELEGAHVRREAQTKENETKRVAEQKQKDAAKVKKSGRAKEGKDKVVHGNRLWPYNGRDSTFNGGVES